MLIKKISQLTGKTHEMELDVTLGQLNEWRDGALIQKVFPNLSADQREFLISGITAEEWQDAFGTEEDFSEERDCDVNHDPRD
jgi:hypothetical protein